MVKKVLADIHRYWFGELKSPADTVAEGKRQMWFRRSAETDAHIRDTFGKYLAAAVATEWEVGNLSREEQVALVLLFDQFPRNIFRDSGEAYAYDERARAIARRLIEAGLERFHPEERPFVLMPLMHSEDPADQDRSVLLFALEAVTAADSNREGRRSSLDYATRHRDVIRRFGRFPHRNEELGRASTAEETEFLKTGRGF